MNLSKKQLQLIVDLSKKGFSEQVIANKLGISLSELEDFFSKAAEEHTKNINSPDAITFREYLKFRDDDRLNVLQRLKDHGTGYWVFPDPNEFPGTEGFPPQYIKGNSTALKDYLNLAYPEFSNNKTIQRLSYELEEAKKELEWYYKHSDKKYNANVEEDIAARVLQDTVLALIDQSKKK
jgi:hypothetical protein